MLRDWHGCAREVLTCKPTTDQTSKKGRYHSDSTDTDVSCEFFSLNLSTYLYQMLSIEHNSSVFCAV